ncbi:TonB-dependent receptor [Novosphingobium mangrovi (ex Huang et al. 2023)]|uniref:TonB-dependent receptor n=1 Tax=Novosphingobium mangrovi (ex Huang et al. 2023) TaxID=2976432 RepID=A0ABT2I9X1_9SPHN|nr:TonB-dependent receptor [Novosphingobium mangrovi (ex Huang et al. 2023)]MCT2401617.1 TonB-dependent receptor [Novosphingobium mangrovi (ex Huang et al. 2023)]
MKTSLRLVAGLLASASFVSIAHAGELSGNVNDATGTRSLQSATVRIVELDRATETDRSGHYIFADIPAGEYTVEVSYVGAIVETRKIAVPATGGVEGNFAMAGIGGADILVVGQAANQASALSRQKAADGVESVLTRDAIGQFPDQNVAESLRRLPGLNILNDQGEGRFVSVRGLDPELNSTSLNGVRLPAPESDTRQVALDVISSDIIESIEVKKSLTPDMDADTIGASIEINTTSAFDRKKDYYAIRAEGSWNDYSDKVTPKGSLDFSTRLGDDFGIAGGISYYKREFETDNVESELWEVTDDGTVYNPEVEYRDYDVTRKRVSAALSFDWRVSDTTKAYARGNWSQFDDHEYRRRTTFIFDKEPSTATANGVSFSDEDGEIEVRRDLKDRFERQRIRSVVIGSDTDTGVWKFNWSASYAKSTEKEDFSVDPTRFRKKFEGDGVVIDWDYSNERVPVYSIAQGADEVNKASNYKFNRTELTTNSDSQDEEYAVRADLARTFAGDNGDFTVQAGAKQRWRKKSYNFDMIYYGDYDGSYTLADVLGSQTYRLLDMGPVASKTGPADFLLANRAGFEIDDYETALASNSDDYSVKEDVTAAYLLGRWDSDSLRVIGGLRMEHTKNEMNGNLILDAEPDVGVTPIRYKRSYTDWLPSLTLRYSPQQDLVMRVAGYKSVVRPKLSNMAPRFTINEDDEAEFGNPYLKPYKAWNFDAGFEYYFSGNGAVSFAGFYKKIDDFIVDVTLKDPGTYLGIDYEEATIPMNGDSADVVGFEASYSQVYSMLPAPFDGLLTQVNYTYTYSKGTVLDEDGMARSISLLNNSRNTFNVVLGYDKGPLDLRVAGTYRDKYLDELGADATEDRWVDNHFQIDISVKYKVTDNVRLFADWVNVNNAKYFAYHNFEGGKRLLQYEEYGPTVKFGARVTF